MSEYNTHVQERTAREMLTQRPHFLGTAGDAAVYWDGYERAFAIVADDGDAERVELAETPFDTPRQYCDEIGERRGWDTGPHIGGTIADDIESAVEAAQ